MNLTIVLATIPAAMLLYGTIVPKSSTAFWELYGWVALAATLFIFGFRYVQRKRLGVSPQEEEVSEPKGSKKGQAQ
jgi:hypothetical protein